MVSNLWLYQMSTDFYSHAGYRLDIWERSVVGWPKNQVKGHVDPAAGDRIITWFANGE